MATARSIVVLLTALVAVQAGAATHVVDVNGGYDFVALVPAVEAAASGDTIVVHPGTYSGADNTYVNFGPKNLVVRSSDGPLSTIIDGGGTSKAFTLLSAVTDTTTRIEGFTFTHCWARGAEEDGASALYCLSSAPIVEDCIFVENEGNFAGAVNFLYGSGIMRSCAFIGNDAVAGGALHSSYSSPVISHCTFIGNSATASGGAFRAFSGAPVLRNCTFAQNATANGGGCLQFDGYGAAGTVERCIIAFSTEGRAVFGTGVTTANTIVYQNAWGDSLQGTHYDNHFGDPRFCGLAGGDLTLCANSWGLAANNTWGVDVGSQPQGCPPCDAPVTGASWGSIKALYR